VKEKRGGEPVGSALPMAAVELALLQPGASVPQTVATGRWLPPPSRLTSILQSPSNSRHGAFGRRSAAYPPRLELYERCAAEDGSLAGLGRPLRGVERFPSGRGGNGQPFNQEGGKSGLREISGLPSWARHQPSTKRGMPTRAQQTAEASTFTLAPFGGGVGCVRSGSNTHSREAEPRNALERALVICFLVRILRIIAHQDGHLRRAPDPAHLRLEPSPYASHRATVAREGHAAPPCGPRFGGLPSLCSPLAYVTRQRPPLAAEAPAAPSSLGCSGGSP
jgi:hypothetical protein